MKTGLYKVERRSASKRAGLFIKVFLATLALGVAAVFVAPNADKLILIFFPARASESSREAAPEPVFKDVSVEDVDARAIAVLKNEGVIKGFEDGSFRSEDKITREEFAKLVVSATKASPIMLGNSHCFSDVGSEWFAPYVCYAKRKKFVGGYDDGSFGTGKTITVFEGISMLNKVFGPELIAVAGDDRDLTRGAAAGMLAKAMRLIR